MQLSKKQKTFPQFFAPFLESKSSFEHFKIIYDPHGLSISKIMDCKRCGLKNV